MPAAPTAAPPTPAPIPSAPGPAPAPPPPIPAGEKQPGDYMADIESDLGKMDAGPAAPPKPEPSKPKGKVAPPAEPVKAPEAPPEAPAAPAEPPKPVRAAELRNAYEALKKEANETLRPTIQRLEARVKELESTPPVDPKPLTEKMTALEKRNRELEEHIKFVDFIKSEEFKTKYDQPFAEAWGRAVQDFTQLTVRIPDGEDEVGEPKFKTRAATADDLLYLANLPLSQMDDQAEAMFGRSHGRVILHVEKIRDLYAAKERALAQAQKLASEREAQMTTARQKNIEALETASKALETKYPAMFGPEEGDAEGNAMLAKGIAEADRAIRPTAENRPRTAEEAIALHARVRMKAANHDRLALRLKKMRAELEATKKALAEYEESEPAAGRGGEGGGGAHLTPEEQIAAELKALDR